MTYDSFDPSSSVPAVLSSSEPESACGPRYADRLFRSSGRRREAVAETLQRKEGQHRRIRESCSSAEAL
jgi:hypothetical protein